MKAIIDDKIPYIKGEIERLIPDSSYIPGNKITPDDVSDADVLIVRTRTRCDRHLLEGSKVRLIVTATIGYDHIDTSWCEGHGIEWHNCPGCNANSVATYIKNALTLSATHFSFSTPITIGIVGCGHVGSIVVSNCEKAGYHVVCHDPLLGMNNWNQLCREADIITFHVPLTRDGLYPTYHAADKDFFASLQKRPLIINSSRGGVIDEPALLEALDSGKVRGAVIDTWEDEPHINATLLAKAFIATPHIAGYSANGKMNATRMSLQTVAHWIGHDGSEFSIGQQASLPANGSKLTPATLMSDSASLKAHPEDFESFRSNYPQRFEPYQN